MKGAIAQLAASKSDVSELSDAEEEQRTENPCVPCLIPGGTTSKKSKCK